MCRATKNPCRAQPPDDMDQFHSEDSEAVYHNFARQYNDVMQGRKRKVFAKDFVVDDALIGDEATDVERVSVLHEKKSFGMGPKILNRELWLHDTEGRPIGYMKIMEPDDRDEIQLFDVEIRPEFRGRRLSHRFIRAVSKKLGKPMVHRGGYTPEGAGALAKLFGREDYDAAPSFNSMTFVEDWDREWCRWPL